MNVHSSSRPRGSDAQRPCRVLVVDDHPIVRQGLTQLIGHEPDFEVCGEAGGFSEAIRLFRDLRPNLVVLDVTLQDGSGLELIKTFTALSPRVPMLVVSMHDESLFAERAIRAGAKGYLEKGETPERLMAALRRILSGRIYLSEVMTDHMLGRSIGNEEEFRKSPIKSLSDRELEVFEQIGLGMTTRDIADKLHLSPKTIETYRENIKGKLNLRNATQLTQHAVKWVLESTIGGDRRTPEEEGPAE